MSSLRFKWGRHGYRESFVLSVEGVFSQYFIDAECVGDVADIGRVVLFLLLQPAKGKNTQAGIRQPITIQTIKQIECDVFNRLKS
jgi:hypothetical protein